MTSKAPDFSTETHQESSIVNDLRSPASGAGDRSEEDSRLEIPRRSISLERSLNTVEKGEDLYHSGREAQLLAASYESCNSHDDISTVNNLDDGRINSDKLETRDADSPTCQDTVSSSGACLEGVMLLLRQAVESGWALILDDQSLDANIVFERSIALAKTAPPGPVFQHRVRKSAVQRSQKDKGNKIEDQDTEVEAVSFSENRIKDKFNSRNQRRDDFPGVLSDMVPQGTLRVDELAKLLV